METDSDVLRMAYDVVQAGAAGITFGRNVWQSDNTRGVIRALQHIIHNNGSVDEAMSELTTHTGA